MSMVVSILRIATHLPLAPAARSKSQKPDAARAYPLSSFGHNSATYRVPRGKSDGTRDKLMVGYNLFSRRGSADICCAVPEDLVVPSFVAEARWEFAGKVDEHDPTFDGVAAGISADLNGFYLFQRV